MYIQFESFRTLSANFIKHMKKEELELCAGL